MGRMSDSYIDVAATGLATAAVWPWPSAKVYDLQGFYERPGTPGPYSAGIWSRWEAVNPLYVRTYRLLDPHASASRDVKAV
jgi:hypothetical protein